MTIGYEGMTQKDFLGVLKRCRVTMLVDVRELAISSLVGCRQLEVVNNQHVANWSLGSRKPGFAKAALSADLELCGVKYEHLVELGCPKEVRHAYRDDGDWLRYTRKYKTYLETQEAALLRLWNLMQDEQCCLMCFEEDFNFCHRSFIAERVVRMAELPTRAMHLTGPLAGRVVQPDLVTVLAGR